MRIASLTRIVPRPKTPQPADPRRPRGGFWDLLRRTLGAAAW